VCQEYKAFNSLDGHGIKMLQRNGVAAGIITGRTSEVVKHRVKDLDIKYVHQGCKEKLPVYRQLISELKLAPEQTAYVGDDVVDLPIMLRVGLAIAVKSAHPLARQYAHWVTPSGGGYGEACEMIVYAHVSYHAEMRKYLPGHGGRAGG
jgi:3-deoxy-D-manno-octulosonate 8-phosphate phosphatase (KDO 8-P phosphatase)